MKNKIHEVTVESQTWKYAIVLLTHAVTNPDEHIHYSWSQTYVFSCLNIIAGSEIRESSYSWRIQGTWKRLVSEIINKIKCLSVYFAICFVRGGNGQANIIQVMSNRSVKLIQLFLDTVRPPLSLTDSKFSILPFQWLITTCTLWSQRM